MSFYTPLPGLLKPDSENNHFGVGPCNPNKKNDIIILKKNLNWQDTIPGKVILSRCHSYLVSIVYFLERLADLI